MSLESLKSELSKKVQDGRNASELIKLQGELLGRIKEGILKELALASTVKQTTVKRFLGFKIHEETIGGLQHIEQLQSDLRVVMGYESLLEGTIQEAEGAKANIETIEARA